MLSIPQIYQYAINAGFPTDTAVKMVAIALKESAGNERAFNGNAATGDLSYGLWQINMRGALGPSRLAQFGITRNEDLYNPAVNAMAAFLLWGGNDANLARHWYIKDGSYNQERYERNLGTVYATLQGGEESPSEPSVFNPDPGTTWELNVPREITVAGGSTMLPIILGGLLLLALRE